MAWSQTLPPSSGAGRPGASLGKAGPQSFLGLLREGGGGRDAGEITPLQQSLSYRPAWVILAIDCPCFSAQEKQTKTERPPTLGL